jgi:hypothetical protein
MTLALAPLEAPVARYCLDLTGAMPIFKGLILTDRHESIVATIKAVVREHRVTSGSGEIKWNVNAPPFTPAIGIGPEVASKESLRLEFERFAHKGKVLVIFRLFCPQVRELREIYEGVNAAVYTKPKAAEAKSYTPLFF